MRPIFPIAGITLALFAAGCDRGADDNVREPSTQARGQPAARPAPAPSMPAPTTAVEEGTPARATLAPSSPQRDSLHDTVITGKIKAAILTDPGMTGADVSVNTDKGVVALAGSVKSQEQIAIASAHAQRQDGVLRVDNHLAMNAQ